MNRAHRSEEHDLVVEQLQRLHLAITERLGALVTTRRTDRTAFSSVRLDNMILLTAIQLKVVRRVVELMDQGRHEEALFFWSMQFQTRAFVEVMSASAPATQPNPVKHSKLERRELFPTSPDFLKAPSSSQSGQSVNLSVSCQVAHLQMPLGQEFVGWGSSPSYRRSPSDARMRSSVR